MALGVAMFCGGAAGAATAAPSPGGDDDALSPRLSEISVLPLSGSGPAAADELAEAAPSLGGTTASGAGSLQVDAEGRVAVSVLLSSGPSDDDLAAIRSLGEVVGSSTLFHRVSAYVAPADLPALAALPGVTSVAEALAPAVGGSTSAWSAPTGGAPVVATASDDSCRTVPANLAAPLRADVAATAYGVDGEGVTIGVISDSYDTSAKALSQPEADIAAGLLPGPGNPCGWETPVEVLTDGTAESTDEGRAMAQLVHGIAPASRILFAAAGIDELTFHDAIVALADAGADVIVDDITMLTDPFYQEGPIGYAVEQVTARGVAYLAAAGNFTTVGVEGYPSAGHAITSYETLEYAPTACPADLLEAVSGPNAVDCLDFDPGEGEDPTDTLTLTGGDVFTATIQWAEPVGGAVGGFRFAIRHEGGSWDVGPANAAGIPAIVGGFTAEAGDYDFVVIRDTSAGAAITPRLKLLFADRGQMEAAEYFESGAGVIVGPTITGHAGAPDTMAVAAAPFSAPLTPEPFTSAGPKTYLFDYQPEVSPVATPLPEPVVVSQPQFMSVDGGYTNYFGDPVREGVYAFFGTSAASPAAAAVFALGKELRPDATVGELREALTSTARPVEAGLPGIEGSDIVGSGLIDAEAYLAAVAELPRPTPSPTPTPTPAPTPAPAPAPSPGSDTDTAGSNRLAATGTTPASLVGPAAAGVLAVLMAGAGMVLLGVRRRGSGRRRS